ncbi:MAG: hypothetical protein U1E26_05530 [Coriobacteriia bacterium]|nr:hypothetical protein [Coriobacteriia bacterium]
MAVAARDLRHERQHARRPRLALAPPVSRTARGRTTAKKSHVASSRPRCASRSVARNNYRMLAVVVIVLMTLGMGRVWLSVQAAEASLESYELRRGIKAERYKGDMLEIQQSALSSPSRIRAIAGATMDMTTAGEATVLDLPPEALPRRVASQPKTTSTFERVLADAMGLAAGEAQVLLVGDVGLASAR